MSVIGGEGGCSEMRWVKARRDVMKVDLRLAFVRTITVS